MPSFVPKNEAPDSKRNMDPLMYFICFVCMTISFFGRNYGIPGLPFSALRSLESSKMQKTFTVMRKGVFSYFINSAGTFSAKTSYDSYLLALKVTLNKALLLTPFRYCTCSQPRTLEPCFIFFSTILRHVFLAIMSPKCKIFFKVTVQR